MTFGPAALNRLRDEVRKLFSQQTAAVEEEFRSFQGQIASSLAQINAKLGLLKNADVPLSAEVLVVEEAQRKDQEIANLAHFAHDMLQKETQEEILTLLLEGTHQFAPRVALFIARGDQFSGWHSRGFSHSVSQQINQTTFPKSESPLLAGALKSNGLDTASDLGGEKALSKILRSEAPTPWHAFPLKAIQRPVAVLLATPDSDRNCSLESLAVAMVISGLRLENLALKILQEAQEVSVSGRRAPEPARAEPVSKRAGEVMAASPPPVEKARVEPASIEETAHTPWSESRATETEEEVQAPASGSASSWSVPEPEQLYEDTVPDLPMAETFAPTPPEIISEDDLYDDSRTLTEEQKLHAQARRFARLLVSEIKLYNEQRVAEGRANKDLYIRLKRDIDKSREMYEQRISQSMTHKFDYFHDELIRILGDNDSSSLGSDYPGPRVGS
jgi:hypothetical protein